MQRTAVLTAEEKHYTMTADMYYYRPPWEKVAPWREELHPRADGGRFGDKPGVRKPAADKPAAKPTAKPATKPLKPVKKPKPLAAGNRVDRAAYEKTHREWRAGLKKEERDAIDFYTGDDEVARDMREADRGKGTAMAKEKLKHLYSALDKAPVYPGKLARGFHCSEEEAKSFKAGQTIEINSITSFTKSRAAAVSYAGYDMLETTPYDGPSVIFEVADNKSGVDVSMLAGYEFEQEALVKKGTKYKVVKVEEREETRPRFSEITDEGLGTKFKTTRVVLQEQEADEPSADIGEQESTITGQLSFEDQPGAVSALSREELMARKEITRTELAAHMVNKVVGKKKLSERLLNDFERSVNYAAKNFTGSAMKQIARNVNRVMILDIDKLKEEFRKSGGKDSGINTIAFYSPSRKMIALSDAVNQRVTCHEMAHALDKFRIGGAKKYTSKEDWKKIWKEEIVGNGALRSYSTKNESEGFAVALESILTTGNRKWFKETLPRTYSYFVKKKIIRKDLDK